MADDAVLESFPLMEPFHPLDFSDDFTFDLSLSSDMLADLEFDGDVEFSIDDLLNCHDLENDSVSQDDGGGGGCGDPVASDGSDTKEGSGVSSLSPVSGKSGSCSPENRNYAVSSSYSGASVMVDVSAADEVKFEERNGLGLKRKKEMGDGDGNREVSANVNSYPRSNKLRRSRALDEASSPCVSNAENEDDEKRRTRLIRNRESAQLSRQRRKHYVEELEEKVRSMNSMIIELNGKISYFMAENVSLRQQLGGKAGNFPTPAVYPPVPPMGPVHFPWIPSYVVRPPGSQIPLIPIPRLKQQQPASTHKSKKSDGKRAESKTKKVASVSLLGLLSLMFLIGVLVRGIDFRYGEYTNLITDRYSNFRSGISGHSRGRVLSVIRNFDRLNQTNESVLCSGDGVCPQSNIDRLQSNRLVSGSDGNVTQKGVVSQPSPGSGRPSIPDNASEPLLASLYVPRNDKLVKIDGNLIINSVLASERAMKHLTSDSKSYSAIPTSEKSGEKTSLAIARSVSSVFSVPISERDAGRHSHMYRNPNAHQKALPPGFTEMYNDNLKSFPADRPPKEWFLEGLEGPIFSSGVCTEVFQFDSAPVGGGIIPATSIANVSNEQQQNSTHPAKMKNRRILYSQPIPLNGSTLSDTKEGFARPPENSSSFHSSKSKSMVVSVLIDPREVGDGDGMVQPKSISRIFVVVLVDSVKYITYSCVLPFKSSAPHLVTN